MIQNHCYEITNDYIFKTIQGLSACKAKGDVAKCGCLLCYLIEKWWIHFSTSLFDSDRIVWPSWQSSSVWTQKQWADLHFNHLIKRNTYNKSLQRFLWFSFKNQLFVGMFALFSLSLPFFRLPFFTYMKICMYRILCVHSTHHTALSVCVSACVAIYAVCSYVQ